MKDCINTDFSLAVADTSRTNSSEVVIISKEVLHFNNVITNCMCIHGFVQV